MAAISPTGPKLDADFSQTSVWSSTSGRFESENSQKLKSARSLTNEFQEANNIEKSSRFTRLCDAFLANYKTFLIGLAIGALLAAVGLAAVLTFWLNRNDTTTTTSYGTTATATPLCTPQSYSQSFIHLVAPSSAQCTAWATFRALLTCSNYTLLQFYGSLNPTGISVVDPTVVNSIAFALFNYTSYGPITSNGYSWAVDPCVGSVELTVGAVCSCAAGYAIRPCISNGNWGGLNGTTTCRGENQTVTIAFS